MVDEVRRLVRHLRPTVPARVYRRVVTLAAEQAQVDWGTFGTIPIGRGVRTVSGFVMVLGYSRALFALFTLDQTLESFLRGHVAAFEAFGGSARTLVYDNLRSAVLDRRGTAIQFHPRLLELAGHYHFAPQPCTPGRGNEKGKMIADMRTARARADSTPGAPRSVPPGAGISAVRKGASIIATITQGGQIAKRWPQRRQVFWRRGGSTASESARGPPTGRPAETVAQLTRLARTVGARGGHEGPVVTRALTSASCVVRTLAERPGSAHGGGCGR